MRRPGLKELAQQVIDRQAMEADIEVLEGGDEDLDPVSLSPTQEAARAEVLAQLEAHPTVKRAFVNRFNPDGTMVVTLAIRGVGTGELLIPADRFTQASLDDYAALLGIIGGAP